MPYLKTTIDDRRRERRRRAKSRRKKSRVFKRLLQNYGPELAEAYQAVCNSIPAHAKARMFALKQEVASRWLGYKPNISELNRIEWINHVLGLPLLTVGWECQSCNTYSIHSRFFDLDHIIPVSDGGTDDPQNFQLLCPNCHKKKSLAIDGFTMRESFRKPPTAITTQEATNPKQLQLF